MYFTKTPQNKENYKQTVYHINDKITKLVYTYFIKLLLSTWTKLWCHINYVKTSVRGLNGGLHAWTLKILKYCIAVMMKYLNHCFDEITKIFNPFAFLSSIIESLLKTQTAYKLEWSLRMNQIAVYIISYFLILNT